MKKGFTLIELLAVIAILGIIVMITVPIINGVVSTSKSKAYDRQKELIVEAARSYMSKNAQSLPVASNSSACVNVSKLKESGFLPEKTIKNSVNQEIMNGSVKVTPNITGSVSNTRVVSYTYTYINSACPN